MNAEQASKKVMRAPTRLTIGEGRRRWKKTATRASNGPAGVMATACIQGAPSQHGKPQRVVEGHQPETREGQSGPYGVADRLVVPVMPGNAGGGKGPEFGCACEGDNGRESGASL